MVWLQLSIKLTGLHFGNSVLDNSNWDKVSHSLTKKQYLEQSKTLFEMKKKKNCKPNPLTQTLVFRSNIYYSKIYQKGNWKKQYKISSGTNKIWPPRHLAQLSVWKIGLCILDVDTQLNSLELKWICRLLNPTNALWKGLMRCQFNLKLNSNQGLFLFIQKQRLRSSRQINLEKQNNEDFFRKNKAIYRKKKNAMQTIKIKV